MRVALGWPVVAASIGLASGCGAEKNESTASATDFERGTMADVRLRACSGFNLWGLSYEDSLAIVLTMSPEAYEPGVACVLAAEDCAQVLECEETAFSTPSLEGLPVCGDARSHCEGNILKRCTTRDDVTWYERSYDCALANAHCEEGIGGGENGDIPWVECVADEDLCEGARSHCDGTVAIVCRADVISGLVNPGVYDCADVFGSSCAEPSEGRVECEGPAVGEAQCGDEQDNDDDGASDCDDSDCEGRDLCPVP